MSIKIGELVKWHENYDDLIVSDAGPGLIVKRIWSNLGLSEGRSTLYDIYRFKHADIKRYAAHDVEILEVDQNG
jgi:hypothetical protein